MWKWSAMVLAIIGTVMALKLAFKSVEAQTVPPPFAPPVQNPYPRAIAGAGLVEPSSENVVIGVPEAGRVEAVLVAKGQAVKAGAPLFRLDTRALDAELTAARAVVNTAEAELSRVKAYRRKEDEPGLRAKLADATAAIGQAEKAVTGAQAMVTEQEWALRDAEARVHRLEVTAKANASPEEDLDRARYQVEIVRAHGAAARERVLALTAAIESARAKKQLAQSDLDTFLAGPWPPDVQRAQAAKDEAQARVARLEALRERLTVVAPLDAVVLRCNLRAGEFYPATTGQADVSAVVLGSPGPLCVRVDIDEFDARRFKPGQAATGIIKGDNEHPIALEFVRVEPFVVPKRALTNSQRELVDTRVLQVIYRIKSGELPVYVGQQINVYIEDTTPAK